MIHNDFSSLFELLPIGAYRSSPDGRQLRANPALVRLDGYATEAELLAATKDLAQEWYVDPARRELFKHLLETHGQVLGLVSEVYRHKTRERIWVRVHAHMVRGDQGQVLYFEGTVEDITLEHQARAALEASEQRFRAMTELSSDWYWEQDANFRFTRLDVGTRSRHLTVNVSVIGKTRREVVGNHLTDAQSEAHEAVLRSHQAFHDFEFQRPDSDGTLAWHSISGEPIFDSDGVFVGYRGVGRDVSERKQAEEEIRRLAFHDPLTGLPNRRLLMDRLQQTLMASARSRQKGVLLFLDLDKLKALNDEFGHDVGDMLLQQVAQRLQNCTRVIDTVARLGGDEFVVLMEDAGPSLEAATGQARKVGEKILQSLSLPYQLGQHLHQGSTSIGGVILDDPAGSAEAFLRQADSAMYQAKAAGRNALRFYTGA
jgi:diguanylate cyclase (GGDEF)-like protein/PAS domain S-box-containing protein